MVRSGGPVTMSEAKSKTILPTTLASMAFTNNTDLILLVREFDKAVHFTGTSDIYVQPQEKKIKMKHNQ